MYYYLQLFYENSARCPEVEVALERAKEQVEEIMTMNGELLRHSSQICCNEGDQEPSKITVPKDPCTLFKDAALMPKRTHLYFVDMHDEVKTPEPNDVTLLTQFTVDRMSMFDKMVKAWQGPIIAIIYISDAGTSFLLDWARNNKKEIRKYDVKIHVVYKRTVSG